MPERDPNRVMIFDTTLRDGEQSPGCSMTQPEKLRMARALAELGVDVIEAGFPAASPGDWEAVHEIAREVRGPIIAGLARCNAGDIDKVWSAVKVAGKPRIHVFLATSAIHREHKLNMAKEQIIHTAVEGVRYARSLCDDIEFSPEDASRTEPEFLKEVVEAVIEAGATTINVPDTVGYTVPEEFYEVFSFLKNNVKGADQVTFSVHCHNDLGMAVANSLAAVRGGARQVECTINGIGERAGNASLEEVTMALKVREGIYGLHTGIDTKRLFPTSRLLSSITGMPIPRNKAVVGENAFAHESGIHQHGMLKHHSTYEIMRPHDVGMSRTNLVLGKHSGRAALRERIKELGFELSDAELARVFDEFKVLADKKKELFDGDIEALVLKSELGQTGPWHLENLHVVSDSTRFATGRVVLRHSDGRIVTHESPGDGPVDAALKAVEQATGVFAKLRKFEVRSVSSGEDAQGEAVLTCDYNGRSYRGTSVTTDIVESGVRAFIEIVNAIESSPRGRGADQGDAPAAAV
jgi:2-isopropylmalate synthase